MLTQEELSYMREVEAGARPTPAELLKPTRTRDALGDESTSWPEPGDGEPIMVRIDAAPDRVPATVAAAVGSGSPARIVADLVDIRAGDRIVKAGATYEVVTEGDLAEWDTAQVVWGRRLP